MSMFWYMLSFHIVGEKHKLWAALMQDSKLDVKPVLAALEETPPPLDMWKELLDRVYKNCRVTIPLVMLSHQMVTNEQE